LKITKEIKFKLIETAAKSKCNHHVAAVAISKKGNVLGYAYNKHRFISKHGGKHAEQILFDKHGIKINKMFIIRVNKNKKQLPIEPCYICQKIAKKLNIRIKEV